MKKEKLYNACHKKRDTEDRPDIKDKCAAHVQLYKHTVKHSFQMEKQDPKILGKSLKKKLTFKTNILLI